MRNLLYFAIFLLFSQAMQAQNDVPRILTTKGEAKVYWDQENESKKAAKARALHDAKLVALDKAFGSSIIQGNMVKTHEENNKSETTVNTIGNVEIKGEIMQVFSEEYHELLESDFVENGDDNRIYIQCKVKVESKELLEAKLAIETFVTNSNKIVKPITEFFNDNDFFLYFKSPADGYLTVFMDDSQYGLCLLPYMEMPENLNDGMPIEANKEYVFFSNKAEHNYFEDKYFEEDTYQLVAEKEYDQNIIYIIFTKKPLAEPILHENLTVDILSDEERDQYTVPKALKTNKFQKWLLKKKQFRSDIQVEEIVISISKR